MAPTIDWGIEDIAPRPIVAVESPQMNQVKVFTCLNVLLENISPYIVKLQHDYEQL